MQKNSTSNIKVLTYSAICVALSVALNQVPLFSMPWGGSVTPMSMFIITLVGYLFGVKAGVAAGVTMGLINLSLGGFVMHPAQVLLDYPLAFGALGLGGLFRNHKFGLHISFIVGALGRFFFHFLAGWLFFYIWAPEGWNYALYSAAYNIAYIGTEMIITLIVISLPPVIRAIGAIKSLSIA